MSRVLSFLLLLFTTSICYAQVQVQGRVYDITKKVPIESVAVITSSGKGAITDSLGRYSVNAKENDTIYFSYVGKNTNKFLVKEIPNPTSFDISLHVVANELPGVTVRSRNYTLDSIQNRKDYAKYFNYKKPTLSLVTDRNYTPGGVGAAFDLEAIINMFRFKHNRRMESLQNRLIQQEQDKYIDKRFSKWFVTKLTGAKGATLDSFMMLYRPDYELLLAVNDLELGVYIQESYKIFDRVRKGEMMIPQRQTSGN